ncbi:ATPase [bacterium]|jgi:ATP-citrate lyase beta-subunit|nr:ATPase [bacterium]
MAQLGIREADAKALLTTHWDSYFGDTLQSATQSVLVTNGTDLQTASDDQSWLKDTALVAKPDMLFGKRGKNDLVFYKQSKPGDVTLDAAANWIDEKAKQDITLHDGNTGRLRYFVVEPFVAHEASEEYYVAIQAENDHDVIHFSTQGGVEIEENWDSVTSIKIPLGDSDKKINAQITNGLPNTVDNHDNLVTFISGLYRFFRDLHFTYLEINPFIIRNQTVHLLDLVGKVDDTAGFLMHEKWGQLEFPNSFGRDAQTPEEKLIKQIDEKSGASLKLTILNPKGQVWTLVAGGGASVVYADTIADTWDVKELANYGEYSGNPSMQETYQYASTVIDLMTREKDPQGRDKVLLIGGAIANFTDVAKTFNGIIKAFEEHADKLKSIGVKIYVRRGGPNYEIGLKNIRNAARKKLGLPIEVYGPETHITDIVRISYEDTHN